MLIGTPKQLATCTKKLIKCVILAALHLTVCVISTHVLIDVNISRNVEDHIISNANAELFIHNCII